MIDLQLIGYTADLEHLVFDLRAGTGDGRYRVVVDPDLFATMDALRDSRRDDGLPVGDASEYGWDEEESEEDLLAAEDEADDDVDDEDAEDEGSWLEDWEDDEWEDEDDEGEDEDDEGEDEDDGAEATAEDDLAEADDDEESDAAEAVDGGELHVVADESPRPDPSAEIRARAARPGLGARDGDGPTLSPSQIQALLRQGRSVRTVAKAANSSTEWVERWLGPIEAEREKILVAAQRGRLERARLGSSRETMGAAVSRSLRDKGVSLDDVTWEAARRKDGRWRVSAVFTHRKRRTKASWLFDPEQNLLEAANDAGNELGFTRRKQRA